MSERPPPPIWKICEHPFVVGVGRLMAAFGVPVAIGILAFAWGSFSDMQRAVDKLNTTLEITLPAIKDQMIDAKKERDENRKRIRDLEIVNRSYGPSTPGRN